MFLEGELVVDNFAGGGGASSGIHEAGIDVDVALNHDAEACAMYRANYPETAVLHQSIWKADPRKVVRDASRRRGSSRPLPVGFAWFSPDCTDHSKAKGSAPIRNRASRDLAWVLIHWAKLVAPRVIMMENVEEWLGWGPLRQRKWPNGRPMVDLHGNPVWERDPERAGETFRKWLLKLTRLGYVVEWRELRGCDYGSPTIRKRLFLIARRDGVPIVWPESTHGLGRIPYRTAAECIDWSIRCPSIFDRKRPLAEATLRRIARGVRRYILESASPFIVPLTHAGDARVHAIDEPVRTVTTAHRGELGVVTPTLERAELVAAFMAQHNAGARNEGFTGRAVDRPISTLTTRGTQQQVVTAILNHQYSSNTAGGEGDPRKPIKTITTGRHAAVVSAFLQKYYGRGGQDSAAGAPVHTLTTKARMALVTVTIDGESYVIVDIGMRMLTPRELYNAQGFRAGYVIDPPIGGKPLTKTAQIRMCGNSVCPQVATALAAANFNRERVDRAA